MSGAWTIAARCAAPLSWVYEAAVRARNRRYDRPGVARRAALPVISVGNLTVGGTGKTPTVAWLAERLVARGDRPAIVSRGYGGRAGNGPLVVSTGDGPLCPPEISGDEPALLARIARGSPVVVGADRAAAAERARTLGASVVLLDDGFQHRALARDLDVVLLDAARPFGNGRLLPAGELREPIDSLARADVVVLTRAGSEVDASEARRAVAAHRPGIPVVRSTFRRLGFVAADGAAAPAPERAVAFCGIARPDSFRAELAAEPIEIVSFRAFADHHRFTPRELAELRAAARRSGARLVTTQKDLARLGSDARTDAPIALAIELALDDPETLLDAVERAIVRRAA